MTEAERNAVIEECAAVIDRCNREGPYQAIAGARRIRALKTSEGGVPCMGKILQQSCTWNEGKCAVCGFDPASAERVA